MSSPRIPPRASPLSPSSTPATGATPPASTPSTSPTAAGSGTTPRAVIDFTPATASAPTPGLYDLSPGVPSVPLATVVKQLASSPAALQTLVGAVRAKTGISVPPNVVSQLLSDPNRALGLLAFTPADMQHGADALNAYHQTQKTTDPAPAPNLIPGSTFDLANLASVPFTRQQTQMSEVAPGTGVFTGSIEDPSISDDQSKANAVFSEVLNRLADNTPGSPSFTVTYKGKPYTDVGSLVDALQANGNKVTAQVQQRLADFMPLYVKDPKSPSGYVDVADPMMIATGIKRGGQQAIVPATHSQLCFSVSGPDVNANVRFFQGTDGTGFRAAEDTLTPSWTGMAVNDRYQGADAVDALKTATTVRSAILNVASADHFMMQGYGETGVCNDSVALVEQAVHGVDTAYPLLIKPQLLLPEIQRQLSLPGTSADDQARLRKIADALGAMRPDTSGPTGSPEQVKRILQSLPWPAGQEPFPVAAQARKLLEASQ